MSHSICVTCGTQFAASRATPAACPVYEDERQYVPGVQGWTTLQALRGTHRNVIQRIEPDLYGIGTEPRFAIGQRALLVRTPGGNVLWGCVALLDDGTADVVRVPGGLRAIAISHPRDSATMVEWAREFGCPVLLHQDDLEWVMRPGPPIRFWSANTCGLDDAGADGLTLVRCGAHFEGGAVLHWPAGAEGRGALLTGDVIQVVPDRPYVSFVRSDPNLVPLDAPAVTRIVQAVEPFAHDRVCGAWWKLHVELDGKAAAARSTARCRAAIGAPAA